jgi:hypothetical protein
MDFNPWSESLMEYMVSTKLNILNKGNEPTFLNIRRRQVIDLTLWTTLVGNLVSDMYLVKNIFRIIDNMIFKSIDR